MTTVLFVGDSITVGLVGYAQGKTDGSSFRRKAQTALGWAAAGPFKDPNGLLHGGVGGSTTYTFLNGKAQAVVTPDGSPTWIAKYRPDVVHLMLGVNDIISFNESPLDLFKRLDDIAGRARNQMGAWGGRVYVSTICESLLEDEIIRAHALNAKILASYSGADGIFAIDSAGAFNAAISKEGIAKYTVDGTHPNQAGYDLISSSLVVGVGGGAQGKSAPSAGSKLVAAAGIGVAGWALGRSLRWW